MRIVVIGAGPTGVGAAYRLNELLLKNEVSDVEVSVLEREDVAGGLGGTIQDSKGFLWDYGGHITFSHSFPYYDHAVKWAVDEWNTIERNCQVDMSYLFNEKSLRLVPYPAQFAIPLFPENIKHKCLEELKDRQRNPILEAPANFKEWVLNSFGTGLDEHFFEHYIPKVWTVKQEELNTDWVGTRVAKIDTERLEQLCSKDHTKLTNADYGWGPNKTFTFPKYGGTGAVWNSMTSKLPQQWFKFGTEVLSIDPDSKTIVTKDRKTREEQSTKYDALITSMPLKELGKITGLFQKTSLAHNQVVITGVGLKQPHDPWTNPYSFFYYPDKDIPFHRMTFFSNYSGYVTPDPEKYWSLLCEYSRKPTDIVDEEAIGKATVEALMQKGFVRNWDQVQSLFTITLPYGYPIPTVGRDMELKRLQTMLEKHNIFSRGRFGGWKYEVSNQDHSFIQGKEAIDRILFGTSETVYQIN